MKELIAVECVKPDIRVIYEKIEPAHLELIENSKMTGTFSANRRIAVANQKCAEAT